MRTYALFLVMSFLATSAIAKCFDSVEAQPQPVKAEDVAPKTPPAPVPNDPAGPKYTVAGAADPGGPKYSVTSVSGAKTPSSKAAKNSKEIKVVHSGCPREIDGAQVKDIFKGFSYTEYVEAAKQGNDPIAGPYAKVYSQYKGKSGVYYDIYAIAHDEDEMDMSKIVNMDKLEAGKLQLLDKVGGCVYYSEIPPEETEGENEDEHEEVIFLFVQSDAQKPMISKGAVAAGVTEEALKKISSGKDDAAKDEESDDKEEDDADKEDKDEDEQDNKSKKDKDSAPVDAKDDNDDEGDFDFSGGPSSDEDGGDDDEEE